MSSMDSAGICSRACVPSSMLGFPSTYTRNPELPLKDTSPSASTLTDGIALSMSTAEPPEAEIDDDPLTLFLSSLYTTGFFSAVRTVPSRLTTSVVSPSCTCPYDSDAQHSRRIAEITVLKYVISFC